MFVPHSYRSLSLCRIPLNMFVVLLLLKIKYLSPERVFMICTCAHALSLVCYWHFYSGTKSAAGDPFYPPPLLSQ